jgi:predicted RNA-binding protein YlqC (UPF0109 family)
VPDDRDEPRQLLELLAKALVDAPAEVRVTGSDDGRATVFELRVAEDDLGKVIGKQGRTARAIRTLLSTAGAKRRRRIVLDIVE